MIAGRTSHRNPFPFANPPIGRNLVRPVFNAVITWLARRLGWDPEHDRAELPAAIDVLALADTIWVTVRKYFVEVTVLEPAGPVSVSVCGWPSASVPVMV